MSRCLVEEDAGTISRLGDSLQDKPTALAGCDGDGRESSQALLTSTILQFKLAWGVVRADLVATRKYKRKLTTPAASSIDSSGQDAHVLAIQSHERDRIPTFTDHRRWHEVDH